MKVLEAGNITFEKSPAGYLNARHNGDETFVNIRCVPLFPITDQDRFISVLKKGRKDYEELGIIKDLADFPPQQQSLVREDVSFRYFVPEVLDIVRMSNKDGTETLEVKTDRGDKTIRIKDRKESVHITDKGVMFIADIDKCRYRITDIRKLREKAQQMAERLLL